jgi:hypothetical protein
MNELSNTDYFMSENQFDREKEDWIYLHGSEVLQRCFLSGYRCEDGYIEERIEQEYPGFQVSDRYLFSKSDMPSEYALNLSARFENSYCGFCDSNSYLIVDNYLGKYTIVKKLNPFKDCESVNPLWVLKCIMIIVMLVSVTSKFIFFIKDGKVPPSLIFQAIDRLVK